LKILTLISGGDKGGAKTAVLSLLREVIKSADVLMICFMESEFTADARTMGINTLILAGANTFKVLDKIKAIIDREKIDIIHSHGSRGNFMAWLLKRSTKLPLISTVHSDYRLDYMGRPLAGLIYGTLNRLALRNMDYLIGISDFMSELLISRGIKPDRIYTINNGIDLDAESRAVPREEFFKQYGIKPEADCIYVGIAARFEPVKDISTLIRGFAIAAKEQPKLRLLIAGQGPEENALKTLAAELGVDDRVYFLGWVNNTDSFYSSLDINTLTSLSETFGYVLAEGARFRLAAISSKVGGVPKLIDHGVSGLLFEAGDSEALAGHLIRLASDKELRLRMADKLYEKTKRQFSLSAASKTQLEIYESVLRRHTRIDEPRRAVAVCGSYGLGNTGDEAILTAILNEIREADPDIPIYVISRDPKNTRMVHKVRSVHTFNVFSFAGVAKKICLYINGGGSLIQDVTSRRSLWFYLYTIWSAKKNGAKVLMYGCGIGPVNYKGDRKLAGRIISKYADVITLREDSSFAELEAMDVRGPEIILAADPALSLQPCEDDRTDSTLISAGMDPAGRYACFALRPWKGFEEKAADIAETANILYEREGLTPVFLSIDSMKDSAAARAVISNLRVPYFLLNGPYEPGNVIGIMSRMTAVISMRLHALIFSAGHGIPLVGIVYDPKVDAFLDYIGQKYYLKLDMVSTEGLLSLVRSSIKDHSPEAQKTAIEKLRRMEMVNRRVLARLLDKERQL
jgi:polysaccharide pyruvyl transferase CsaB